MVARVIDHPFGAGVIPTPYNPDPALLAIVEIIRDGLVRDQHVRLHNFGTFRLRWCKERSVKHPKTGNTVTVAPVPKVTFTPAKHLRELVDPDRKPSMPLGKPVDENTHKDQTQGTNQQLKQDYSTKAVQFKHEQQEDDLPNLAESVQDIIDGKYNSPEVNISNFYSPQDVRKDMDEKSGKKWTLGLLAAVPLILILLQADFTTGKSNVADKFNASKPTPVVKIMDQDTGFSRADIRKEKDIIVSNLSDTHSSGDTHPEVPASASAEQRTRSFYMSPQLHTIKTGENLWKLAERFYGDALLWPHIFRANMRTITDPDQIIPGRQLVIPGLQQALDNLSRKDKELIAKGYYEVYKINKAKDYQKAIYFLLAAKQYNFEWLIKIKPVIPRNDWQIIERN